MKVLDAVIPVVGLVLTFTLGYMAGNPIQTSQITLGSEVRGVGFLDGCFGQVVGRGFAQNGEMVYQLIGGCIMPDGQVVPADLQAFEGEIVPATPKDSAGKDQWDAEA